MTSIKILLFNTIASSLTDAIFETGAFGVPSKSQKSPVSKKASVKAYLPSNFLKGLIKLLSAATGYDLCQGLSAEWRNCSRYFQKLQDWKKPVCNASPCNGNKIGKDKIKTGIAFGGFRSK